MTNDTTMYPCLFYDDAPSAMAWLARVVGFETLLSVPGDDGGIAHAEMSLGVPVIMLGSAGTEPMPAAKSPRDLRGYNQSLYVFVPDPKPHYARAKAEGAAITREYEEKDYGGAGYSATDLEGHEWSFGSYRPELPSERVAKSAAPAANG